MLFRSRVYSYGTGGPPAAADKPVLAWLGEQFAEEGYRLPDLLRTVASSQPFVSVNDPAVAQASSVGAGHARDSSPSLAAGSTAPAGAR